MQLHIVVLNSASTRYEGYAGEIRVNLDSDRDVIIRMDEVIKVNELDSTGVSI